MTCFCFAVQPSRDSFRSRLFLVLLLGWLAFPSSGFAHTPFESNARITILENQIEVSLIAGSGLTEKLLVGSGVTALPQVGPGLNLPLTQAPNLFQLQVAGTNLPAALLRVLSDGLESTFVVTYPRPDAAALQIRTAYVQHLPSGQVSPLILTDDENRILGTHLARTGNETTEFPLPKPTAAPPLIAGSNAVADSGFLQAPAPAPLPTSIPALQPTLGEYLRLGIHHIVTGYDHLLFLCGLLVGCKRIGPMLAIITCFTLAHSITLALAALDIFAVSPRIVEPIIAASIIFVGLENFRRGDHVKARCWLALGFGLIHGFGFAGALRDTGLGAATGSLVPALFSFNLGVELGQLFIASIFLGVLWQLRRFKPIEQYATPVISIGVITLGGWWLVERAFLS